MAHPSRKRFFPYYDQILIPENSKEIIKQGYIIRSRVVGTNYVTERKAWRFSK